MLNVNGVDLNFDITSPADVVRYKQAGERMEAAGAEVSYPSMATDDPGFLDAYVDMLNRLLRLYGNFLDEAFGEGTADALLGANPSLTKVQSVVDAIGAALAAQGRDFGVALRKYQPNRATRRGQK